MTSWRQLQTMSHSHSHSRSTTGMGPLPDKQHCIIKPTDAHEPCNVLRFFYKAPALHNKQSLQTLAMNMSFFCSLDQAIANSY